MAQTVKHLPTMWETRVHSLGWEDPLDEEIATYSNILVYRIPWTEEPDGLQSTGSQRVGHHWATSHTHTHSKADLILNSKLFTFFVLAKKYRSIDFLFAYMHLPCSSDSKESACNAGDLGSISGSGRSSGEGNGNTLQYSCLKNPMDRGAWWATVHGVTKTGPRLSD